MKKAIGNWVFLFVLLSICGSSYAVSSIVIDSENTTFAYGISKVGNIDIYKIKENRDMEKLLFEKNDLDHDIIGIILSKSTFYFSKANEKVYKVALEKAKTIFESAKNGDILSVREFIESGIGINARDNNDWTPLLYAIRYNQSETAAFLIERGANINAKTTDGWTPLMMGLKYSSEDISELLIDKGTDINAKNKNGWTPLMFRRNRKCPPDILLPASRDTFQHFILISCT